jgi:hypothetical protein
MLTGMPRGAEARCVTPYMGLNHLLDGGCFFQSQSACNLRLSPVVMARANRVAHLLLTHRQAVLRRKLFTATRCRCVRHRGFAMPACPVSSLDPFADDFLAAPYPFYAELREAGPVVWLERYGPWACCIRRRSQGCAG